ncbi:MAG: hypothetical protein P1V81_15985 [Planctomycetota bacterium]|nr:hypothetical protein [Planctomycetota bacterium]
MTAHLLLRPPLPPGATVEASPLAPGRIASSLAADPCPDFGREHPS